MDEMLDLVRKEISPSKCYCDESTGHVIWIEKDTLNKMFERFSYLHGEILSQQQEVRGRYLIVGACLAEIERDKLYTCVSDRQSISGYSNFYKFCQAIFGFKKATVANILAVYRKFSNEQGLIRVEYFNFSYSQLVELSRMQKNAERITVNCSTRDIKHLRELYEEYVPKPGTTVADDLEEWKRRHDKKKAEANAAKNAITFLPASKSGKNECQDSGPLTEKQDDREISTPDVGVQVSEGAVIKGLLRQLDLLKNSSEDKWGQFVEIVSYALEMGMPRWVFSREEMRAKRSEVTKLQLENLELQRKVGAGLKFKSSGVERSEKFNFKNDDARKEFIKIEAREKWPLWIEIPDLEIELRKIVFANGDALVSCSGKNYPNYVSDRTKAYPHHTLHLITKEHPVFDCVGIAPTYVLEYMKAHKNDI